jgi:uncharacterized phage-associated protein
MNNFVPKIPTWFDTRKAAQVTAFFAIKSGGNINVLMATKLIYLADRLSMEKRDYPITGDTFVSMDFGPVNSYTYSYMKNEARDRQKDWDEFIGARQGHELSIAQKVALQDLDELSPVDVEILEATWEKHKDTSNFKLAEWTHEFCPEWQDPNGSSVPIEYSTVFNALRKEKPVDLTEAILRERRLQSVLIAQ